MEETVLTQVNHLAAKKVVNLMNRIINHQVMYRPGKFDGISEVYLPYKVSNAVAMHLRGMVEGATSMFFELDGKVEL